MSRPGFWRSTFSSLRVPNYRLYFTGQSISLAGTWMQMTAQSWLVLTLTHSSTDRSQETVQPQAEGCQAA